MTAVPQTLRLERTVFHGGKFIRKVTVRQPTQADVDEATILSETSLGRGIALIAIVCRLDPLAVIKLSDDDLERIEALIALPAK